MFPVSIGGSTNFSGLVLFMLLISAVG